MIFVIGATGRVGTQLVAQLADSGHPLRLLVRDPTKVDRRPGVQLVKADLSQPASLDRAFDGARRVFLLTPDMPPDEKARLEDNAVDAAVRSGVDHIVYLSNAGADAPQHSFARWHHRSELKIARSGISWTYLRPNGFMSNVLFAADSIRENDMLPAPAGEGAISAIDPRDVAAVAAKVLTEDGHEGSAYTLTGPAALSHREQAAQLSDVIGRTVTYLDVPESAARTAMLEGGILPPEVVEALLEFYRQVKAGNCAFITPDFEQIMGYQPRTFAAYLKDNAPALAGA